MEYYLVYGYETIKTSFKYGDSIYTLLNKDIFVINRKTRNAEEGDVKGALENVLRGKALKLFQIECLARAICWQACLDDIEFTIAPELDEKISPYVDKALESIKKLLKAYVGIRNPESVPPTNSDSSTFDPDEYPGNTYE